MAVPMDPVAPYSGIAAVGDRHAREGIAEDIIVFNCPLAVVVDKDSRCLAIMDAVAPNSWLTAIPYRYPGLGIAEDIVVLKGPLSVC